MDDLIGAPMPDAAPTGFTVRAHRADPEGTILEIVVPKGAEAEYPIGSSVTMACQDSPEVEITEPEEIEEAGEGPPPIGPKPVPRNLKMGMLLDKFHEEA